jgi:hypothetical protein
MIINRKRKFVFKRILIFRIKKEVWQDMRTFSISYLHEFENQNFKTLSGDKKKS